MILTPFTFFSLFCTTGKTHRLQVGIEVGRIVVVQELLCAVLFLHIGSVVVVVISFKLFRAAPRDYLWILLYTFKFSHIYEDQFLPLLAINLD